MARRTLIPVCYELWPCRATKNVICHPRESLALMLAEQAPGEVLEGEHLPAIQRATGRVHVGGGAHPLGSIALGEPDGIHRGAVSLRFPGVKDKEAIEPDALLVAEPVGPEFVGRANLPRRAEVVDHDFVGGEDEAVGTVVGAPDRLVADGKTLTGFKIEEGELTGSGGAITEGGGGDGGEDR